MLNPRHESSWTPNNHYPDPFAWFRLLDTLTPGSSARASRIYGLDYNNDPATTGEEFYIYDRWFSSAEDDDSHTQLGRNFGLTGEIFQCVRFPGTTDWCCWGSQGLMRRGVADAAINECASGAVSIYVGNPADFWEPFADDLGDDSGVNVTAYYQWITTQDSVYINTPVLVQYFPDWFRWEIIDHRCDDTTLSSLCP